MTRKITAFAYDNFGFLDIVGPTDVFTIANQRAGKKLYEVNTVSAGREKSVSAESGLGLVIDHDIRQVKNTHTLLIPGGDGFRQVCEAADTVREIKRIALKSNRVLSVCTGAFVLAATGLLNNRRATTHWALAPELGNQYPRVNVVADELFVSAGKYTTSAGIAAGIDLALDLVAQDHGTELALETSQRMVLYLNRTGGQSQFSERFHSHVQSEDTFDQLLCDIATNPTGNLTNALLAERLNISERHFTRLFNNRTGTSPARWLERVRVDHARAELEAGTDAMKAVATKSGFASIDTMRQAFKRVVGVSPSHYRLNHGRAVEKSVKQ